MVGYGRVDQDVSIERIHPATDPRAERLAATSATSSAARSALTAGASVTRVLRPRPKRSRSRSASARDWSARRTRSASGRTRTATPFPCRVIVTSSPASTRSRIAGRAARASVTEIVAMSQGVRDRTYLHNTCADESPPCPRTSGPSGTWGTPSKGAAGVHPMDAGEGCAWRPGIACRRSWSASARAGAGRWGHRPRRGRRGGRRPPPPAGWAFTSSLSTAGSAEPVRMRWGPAPLANHRRPMPTVGSPGWGRRRRRRRSSGGPATSRGRW